MDVSRNVSNRSEHPLITQSAERDAGQPGAWSTEGRIKTILLAVSTDTPSSGVLDLATELGRRLDATIVALHVREWPFSGSEWVLGEGAFVEGKEEATRLLDHVVRRLRSVGVRARGITGGGQPGQVGNAIVDAANAEHAGRSIQGGESSEGDATEGPASLQQRTGESWRFT
jgi:universal stress protein family protein